MAGIKINLGIVQEDPPETQILKQTKVGNILLAATGLKRQVEIN